MTIGVEPLREREKIMKVIVQDNQIEKAIRDLKKKLTKEGFFSEIKDRRFYDKPSVQKKKKAAKAAKRRRKRMRKFN
jgi:small subunit ribosomal protein S21